MVWHMWLWSGTVSYIPCGVAVDGERNVLVGEGNDCR